MDPEKLAVFNNEYFKIITTLLSIIGLWPYAPWKEKLVRRAVTMFILTVFNYPHVSFKWYTMLWIISSINIYHFQCILIIILILDNYKNFVLYS